MVFYWTAWDCSAWVRTYALFLEERLECFRTLKYDIESERLTKISPGATKVYVCNIPLTPSWVLQQYIWEIMLILKWIKIQAHSRTRLLTREELLDQLPALQQLLYRLIGCQVITYLLSKLTVSSILVTLFHLVILFCYFAAGGSSLLQLPYTICSCSGTCGWIFYCHDRVYPT